MAARRNENGSNATRSNDCHPDRIRKCRDLLPWRAQQQAPRLHNARDSARFISVAVFKNALFSGISFLCYRFFLGSRDQRSEAVW